MPPKPSNNNGAATSSKQFTDKEVALFAAILAQVDTGNCDWDDIAATTGYKNDRAAKEMWRRARTKILGIANNSGATGEASTPTSGRKRSAQDITSPKDTGTPSKVRKATGRARSTARVAASEPDSTESAGAQKANGEHDDDV